MDMNPHIPKPEPPKEEEKPAAAAAEEEKKPEEKKEEDKEKVCSIWWFQIFRHVYSHYSYLGRLGWKGKGGGKEGRGRV